MFRQRRGSETVLPLYHEVKDGSQFSTFLRRIDARNPLKHRNNSKGLNPLATEESITVLTEDRKRIDEIFLKSQRISTNQDAIPKAVIDSLLEPNQKIRELIREVDPVAEAQRHKLKVYSAEPCFRNRKQMRETIAKTTKSEGHSKGDMRTFNNVMIKHCTRINNVTEEVH